MSKLIHEELSYKVRGILFDVYNSLGPGLEENFYTNAAAIGVQEISIPCESEKPFKIFYESNRVGLYYIDVWIDNGKIILENKVAPEIKSLHKAQAISYLKVTNADLAFVVNFGTASLQIERLPNFLCDGELKFDWRSQPLNANRLYPKLTDKIIQACYRMHFVLGPGFLHQVYRRATMTELNRCEINYDYIKQLAVEYHNHFLGNEEACIILIEDKVLLSTLAHHETNTRWSSRCEAC